MPTLRSVQEIKNRLSLHQIADWNNVLHGMYNLNERVKHGMCTFYYIRQVDDTFWSYIALPKWTGINGEQKLRFICDKEGNFLSWV